MLVTMLGNVASAAGLPACLAQDGAASSSDLQAIIDGAQTNDTISVSGVCRGNFQIPGSGSATVLTLMGVGPPPPTWSENVLHGQDSGSVVTIGNAGMTVTFTNLMITHGNSSFDGGGILNDIGGTLILNGTTSVWRNEASNDGGGILTGGPLTLDDSASVLKNTAVEGGGIMAFAPVVMNGHTRVVRNSAGPFGGGIWTENSLTLNDSARVRRNTAQDSGGGIFGIEGEVTLNDSSWVNLNTAQTHGGGIWIDGALLTMTGSARVTRNTAISGSGGGIFRELAAPVVGAIPGGNVAMNVPDNIFCEGGAC
jgi:hypothetical protein